MMNPVRPGSRGPAVEDIQRRLRSLGYDIGPTGVDGVFLGATTGAIEAFRQAAGLPAGTLVDEQTWSALVDATFQLGDRMLYLRMPHFHGADVRVLQQALTVLGFGNGRLDAIFGPYCERAVREFQRNTGLVADGIVGTETVKEIFALRHVWENKEPVAHSAVRSQASRACEGLATHAVHVCGLDDGGRDVAVRVANLAKAADSSARVDVVDSVEGEHGGVALLLCICANGMAPASAGCPVVHVETPETMAGRLLTAVESVKPRCPEVIVELAAGGTDDEHELQRAAVVLLDALCFVFE